MLLSALISKSQTTISGKVTDLKNELLIGVNISILGSYDGGTSKATGDYKFETSEKDSVIIKATYTGYNAIEKKIFLNGKSMVVDFSLKEKVNDLKAVVISAGSFEASDEKKGTVLKALDIVTTAGSNGDSYGALKTLPGTQQVNDREGLFVRGGAGSETQTFIDGTFVRNAFTASVPDLGARGRFNPFIFKGTVFSAGGYSALYGQALSSAVILETIDLPERSSANLNVSSVGVGGSIQTLNKKRKESFGVGYNYVNLTPYFKIIKQNVAFKKAPTVHQIDLNYRKRTSKTGIVKFYGYINASHVNVQRSNIQSLDYADENKAYKDEYGVKNKNLYGNISFKEYYKNSWKLNLGASASYNHDDIGTKVLDVQNNLVLDSNFIYQNSIGIKNDNLLLTAKAIVQKDLNNLNSLRFGGEYIFGDDKNILINHLGNQIPKHLSDQLIAGFAETDLYVSNDLAGKIGVRAEYSALLQKMNIAPRLSAAYKLNRKGQVSFAFGQFYQKPELIYLFNNHKLDFMRADHYILNYQFQPKDRLLRLEAYYKNYKSLLKYNATFSNNEGNGYAKGLELFYRDKKTLNGIDFWISYSLIDSKRDYQNYLRKAQPDFVANHVASFVIKKFWTKYLFGINATYTYSSGRPYVNYNTSNPSDPVHANASLFLKDRTEDYHTFNVSFNYLKTIRKVFSVFVLSVNNPLNFKQVYGYNYARTDLNGDGQLFRKEITPAARQFIFIGVFMSLGIDRTQEAIDGNL
jgi:vitamin B12 transporter